MANTKKIVVESGELPPIQFDETSLYRSIRYRVVSDDRNRYSHWSPIYRINYPSGTILTGNTNIHANTFGQDPKTVVVTWNVPQPSAYESLNTFDVFIQWKDNSLTPLSPLWQYVATVSAKSFSIAIPNANTHKHIDVDIQIPSALKQRDEKLVLFRLTNHAV